MGIESNEEMGASRERCGQSCGVHSLHTVWHAQSSVVADGFDGCGIVPVMSHVITHTHTRLDEEIRPLQACELQLNQHSVVFCHV